MDKLRDHALRGGDQPLFLNVDRRQLFDLRKDPDETVNVAGRPEYRSVESDLRKRIEKDWDGPGIKRQVIASHERRDMLSSIPGYMTNQSWKPDVSSPPYPDDCGWKQRGQ